MADCGAYVLRIVGQKCATICIPKENPDINYAQVKRLVSPILRVTINKLHKDEILKALAGIGAFLQPH